MALSVALRRLIRSMREHRMLPAGGALLEIGKASWSVPIDPRELLDDAQRFGGDPQRRTALEHRIRDLAERSAESAPFDAVAIFYEIMLAPSVVQAIDSVGLAGALCADLNHPVMLPRRYDVTVNHGTAEHVFNVAQVFRTMHDYTAPGGLMIHECPFSGCIDHGFYNLHPTLFADVARSNSYDVRGMFFEDLATEAIVQIQSRDHVYELAKAKRIPNNAMLFSVMAKGPADEPFKVPMQAYYSGSLSADGMKAWHELR
jgi:hypothetical protein